MQMEDLIIESVFYISKVGALKLIPGTDCDKTIYLKFEVLNYIILLYQ